MILREETVNGIDNPIVFYPIAAAIVFFASLAIWCKNIFHSLLSAILVFFLAGVLFYILGSEYNAVIQIAVYGLAVPVILGLGIMFTDFRKKEDEGVKSSAMKFAMFFTGTLFVIITFTLVTSGFEAPDFTGVNPVSAISAFGDGIFTRYVLAFEIISLVLTIIIAGLSMFKKEVNK